MNSNFQDRNTQNADQSQLDQSQRVSPLDGLSPAEREAYFQQCHVKHVIKQSWKTYIKSNPTTASQMAAYRLLRGLDLEPAFSPLTRASKIQGYAGGNPYQARDEAISDLKVGIKSAFKPWAELLKGLPTKFDTMYTDGWGAVVAHLGLDKTGRELPKHGEPAGKSKARIMAAEPREAVVV